MGAIVAVFHAGLQRELARGFGESEALYLHHELKNIAALVAAEAVEDLLLGADGEGGGLFVMERAGGFVVAAGLLKGGHVLPDDIGDVQLFPDKFYDGR